MPTATEIDDELLASRQPGSFAVFYRHHVEDWSRSLCAAPTTPSLPPT